MAPSVTTGAHTAFPELRLEPLELPNEPGEAMAEIDFNFEALKPYLRA